MQLRKGNITNMHLQDVNFDAVNIILDKSVTLEAKRMHDDIEVPIKVDSYYKVSDAEIKLWRETGKMCIYLAWTNRAALGMRSDATKDEWLPGIINGEVSFSLYK